MMMLMMMVMIVVMVMVMMMMVCITRFVIICILNSSFLTAHKHKIKTCENDTQIVS